MSMTAIVASAISSLCCCLAFVLFILLIIGVLTMRKKGKKKVTAREAIATGADQVSRVFVRGQKSREEMLAEEDENYK